MPAGTGTPPATADVRSSVLDPLSTTPEQKARLRGHACARCGSRQGLRPAGYAYTASEGNGRLGWPVKVCESCQRVGAGA